jgi:hypothetical protein
MKIYAKLFLIFGLLLCSNAVAQSDLAGTWQGKLAIDPNTKLTIHFILTKKADGSYAAVLNSPDTGGIKNVAASAVKYAGDKLSIDVATLSGSYSGTVAKGTITGEWKQQGSTFPLVLTPYKKPDVSSLKPLLGEWVSKLKVTEGMIITVVFHFEYAKDGKFVSTFDQPDQGAKGLEISDVVLEGNQVSFKIPVASGEYKGTLVKNTIAGIYKVSGRELAMDLVKGKYQAPTAQIDLSADAMKLLLGRWTGKIGPLTMVFRFERNATGQSAVLIDVPEQKAVGLAVGKATLIDDTLSLDVPAVFGKYVGKLSGDKIDGTWSQNKQDIPLSLIKEQPAAPPKK